MLGIYQNTLKKHPTVNAIKYRDWPVWLRLTLDGLGVFRHFFGCFRAAPCGQPMRGFWDYKIWPSKTQNCLLSNINGVASLSEIHAKPGQSYFCKILTFLKILQKYSKLFPKFTPDIVTVKHSTVTKAYTLSWSLSGEDVHSRRASQELNWTQGPLGNWIFAGRK